MCARPHYPRPTQFSNPGYATEKDRQKQRETESEGERERERYEAFLKRQQSLYLPLHLPPFASFYL